MRLYPRPVEDVGLPRPQVSRSCLALLEKGPNGPGRTWLLVPLTTASTRWEGWRLVEGRIDPVRPRNVVLRGDR